MSDLKKWFMAQTDSSKVLVVVASILLIFLMGLEWVFDPWKQKLNTLRLQLDDKVTTIAWMERQINQNQSLIKASQLTEKGSSKSKTSNAKGSLITQIERSAKQVQIYSSIERISPDKTGRVKVWLNNGNFSLLLTWIESLKKNGIDIVDVRANQLELNSSVSITVTFQLS